MIAKSFSFPRPGEIDAVRGGRCDDAGETAVALREAIARGYADGLAQGRRAAETEARAIAENARREGFNAGRIEAQAQVEQAANALREAFTEFEQVRAQIVCQAESFCVELVLATVASLIESDTVRAEFASRVVVKALEVLAPEPPRAIYLNPADRALIGDDLRGLPLKDDSTLAPGYARVEAGRLVVEGGIDSAFEKIKLAMLDVSERRTHGSGSR